MKRSINNRNGNKTLKCTNAARDCSNRHVPIDLRMEIKLNKVDNFKSSIKPQAAQHLSSNFPLWNEWPLDAKIPDYRNTAPQGSLYFTRGKLCQSLYPRRKDFDLTDPKGYRIPVPMSDYTALHDPMAQRYFKNPTVLRKLQCQNLINDRHEVLCGTRNYNKYRNYLSSLQNEMIEKELKNSDELYNIAHDIKKASQTFHTIELKSHPLDPLEKLAKARRLQANVKKSKTINAENRMYKWEQKINAVQQNRLLQRLAADERQIAVDEVSRSMRRMKYMKENFRKKQLLADLMKAEIKRDQASESRRSKLRPSQLKEKKEATKRLALEARNNKLTEGMTQDRILRKQEWIRNYERHLAFVENNQEKIHARRKAAAERVQWIRRKYFDLWRKIAMRHRERPNSVHRSTWKVENELRVTISDLEELANYDVHHNIFSHILGRGNVKSWKAQLKAQLEAELRQERFGSDEDEEEEDLDEIEEVDDIEEIDEVKEVDEEYEEDEGVVNNDVEEDDT